MWALEFVVFFYYFVLANLTVSEERADEEERKSQVLDAAISGFTKKPPQVQVGGGAPTRRPHADCASFCPFKNKEGEPTVEEKEEEEKPKEEEEEEEKPKRQKPGWLPGRQGLRQAVVNPGDAAEISYFAWMDEPDEAKREEGRYRAVLRILDKKYHNFSFSPVTGRLWVACTGQVLLGREADAAKPHWAETYLTKPLTDLQLKSLAEGRTSRQDCPLPPLSSSRSRSRSRSPSSQSSVGGSLSRVRLRGSKKQRRRSEPAASGSASASSGPVLAGTSGPSEPAQGVGSALGSAIVTTHAPMQGGIVIPPVVIQDAAAADAADA